MSRPQANQLRLLFWESTSQCNLRCIHCRRLDIDAVAGQLTTDQVKGVFDSTSTLGKPIIVFSGGEPLLRDDWEHLAGHATSLGLPIALATNGTLIDRSIAQRINKAGFSRVAVSLDGADAAIHDKFRGQDGAFNNAMAGIEAIRASGTDVQINATIAAHNVHQLDSLLGLATELGAVALHLFLLVPVGCGTEIAETHQLPPAEYERVLGWVCDRQQSGSIEIRPTCAPHYKRIAAQKNFPTGHSRGCLAGSSVAFVSFAGDVFGCGYLPVSCGSVLDNSLADIWENSTVFAKLRDPELLTGKCGICNFKVACSGCRARAYAESGDFLGSEPSCSYQPQG